MDLDPTQQVRLDTYSTFVRTLDEDATKEQLVRLYRQILLYDNYYQRQVRQAWGIDDGLACSLGTHDDTPVRRASASPTDDRDSWLGEMG